ncbi:MAG: hypothetical protein ACJA2D_002493 [Pseudohongiellaceae bacterium]|jgi:hypothetical protein
MSDDIEVKLSDSGVLQNWKAEVITPRHPSEVPEGYDLEDYHPKEDPEQGFCYYQAALNVVGSEAQIDAIGRDWRSKQFFQSIKFKLQANSGEGRINGEDISSDIVKVADHYLLANGDNSNVQEIGNKDCQLVKMRLFWCEDKIGDLVVRALIDWKPRDGEGIRTMWSWGMIHRPEDNCPKLIL